MDMDAILLSLKLALWTLVLILPFGIWAAHRLQKAGKSKSWIEAALALPLVLPPTVLGYYVLTLLGTRSTLGRAWESLFGAPLVFTQSGAVVAATVSALPFVIRAARAAISNVDPRVEQAARVVGMSEWKVARVVTMPLAARGIGAGVALGFARALGDFGATVMVAGNIPGQTQTLPVAVYDAVQAGDEATARTGSLVLGGIAVVVLIFVTQVFARRR